MNYNSIKHWSEVIAQEIVDEKKEPFVINSGITTSGPIHMGTMCEILYPSAIVKYLKNKGFRVEFIFIGDTMDAFDGVPKSLEKFTYLKQHLGKPLCSVPDPFICCESYGDHFLNELTKLMDELEISVKIIKADDLIKSGKYDSYAALFYDKKSKVKEIALETIKLSGVSGLPEWVDVVMPICESCGKIATTRITKFDGYAMNYVCDKDVDYTKGCGYRGWMEIKDHRYKLFWRLDWPARQSFFNVSAELAGIDHHTRGGSWDTAVAIHREIFNKPPPVGHQFGFVLLRGKKYSKSKGIGLGVKKLLSFVPPPLLKYKLYKLDLKENKEFNPSGNSLIRLYEEYGKAADMFEKNTKLRRAEHKMTLAYALSTDKRYWRADFAEVLIHYQIYRDWNKVAERVKDSDGVAYLKKYVQNWVKEEYLPEEYVFRFKPIKVEDAKTQILAFTKRLTPFMNDVDVHNLVYSVTKEFGLDKPIFKVLYLSLISKDHGPRFGKLVVAIGIEKVKETMLSLYN